MIEYFLTRFGVHAVELINQGKFGTMVSLKGNRITDVPIEEAVGTLDCGSKGRLLNIAKALGGFR